MDPSREFSIYNIHYEVKRIVIDSPGGMLVYTRDSSYWVMSRELISHSM
jgi:hypothetical protein